MSNYDVVWLKRNMNEIHCVAQVDSPSFNFN